MASLHSLGCVAELDGAYDAIGLLVEARDALQSRHGDRFRDLQRRIEALADVAGLFETVDLPPDPDEIARFVLKPGPRILGLIAEARDLGVIR